MLGPDRTANARQRDVDTSRRAEPLIVLKPGSDVRAFSTTSVDSDLQFVDANPGFALRLLSARPSAHRSLICVRIPFFQRHPAVAKRFEFRIVANLGPLAPASQQCALAGSLFQGRR